MSTPGALIDTDRVTSPHLDPHEVWAIERFTSDKACAARLCVIGAIPRAYIRDVHFIPPQAYVVIWYRFVETEAP